MGAVPDCLDERSVRFVRRAYEFRSFTLRLAELNVAVNKTLDSGRGINIEMRHRVELVAQVGPGSRVEQEIVAIDDHDPGRCGNHNPVWARIIHDSVKIGGAHVTVGAAQGAHGVDEALGVERSRRPLDSEKTLLFEHMVRKVKPIHGNHDSFELVGDLSRDR